VPKYLDALIDVLQHPKIFKFIHLPIQSGNDDVLVAMRRGHRTDTIRNIINRVRERIPDMTLSTDVIVGHPGETEERFHDTLALVRELRFDTINIARFAPRPGTASATMTGQVHGNVSKERSRQLTLVQRHIAYERNKTWIGWEGEIIIDTRVKGGVSGRNYAYKSVFIGQDLPLGSIIHVRVNGARERFLVGECT